MAILGAALGGIIGYFFQNIAQQLIGGYRLGQPRGRKGQFISRKSEKRRKLFTAALGGVIGFLLVPA